MNIMQAIDAVYRSSRISKGNERITWAATVLTEVIRHQLLVAKGVVRANSHDGLVCLHGSKAFGFASGLPPLKFFPKHVEERNNVSETAEIVFSVDS